MAVKEKDVIPWFSRRKYKKKILEKLTLMDWWRQFAIRNAIRKKHDEMDHPLPAISSELFLQKIDSGQWSSQNFTKWEPDFIKLMTDYLSLSGMSTKQCEAYIKSQSNKMQSLLPLQDNGSWSISIDSMNNFSHPLPFPIESFFLDAIRKYGIVNIEQIIPNDHPNIRDMLTRQYDSVFSTDTRFTDDVYRERMLLNNKLSGFREVTVDELLQLHQDNKKITILDNHSILIAPSNASNTFLREAFEKWLKERSGKANSRRRCDGWIDSYLLPYLDISFWNEQQDNKVLNKQEMIDMASNRKLSLDKFRTTKRHVKNVSSQDYLDNLLENATIEKSI